MENYGFIESADLIYAGSRRHRVVHEVCRNVADCNAYRTDIAIPRFRVDRSFEDASSSNSTDKPIDERTPPGGEGRTAEPIFHESFRIWAVRADRRVATDTSE